MAGLSRAYAATTATAKDVTGTPAAAITGGDALFGLTWFPGDTHVHNDHSSDGSFLRQTAGQGSPGNVSVADQIGQGQRAGLAWMPLTDHRTYNQHWDPLWTSSSTVVDGVTAVSGLLLVPGEEANGSPHAVALGLIDEIVDGANPGTGPGHRHIQQSVWDTHAQGGAWGTAHPIFRPDDSQNRDVTGVDWIETWNKASDPDEELDYAEARWNEGLRGGVTGACDCHFRELWAIAGPGSPTTWVLAPSLSERQLLQALRRGHSVVGSSVLGAMVTLEGDFDGDGHYEAVSGDEVKVPAGATGTLRVRVQRGVGYTVTVLAAPGRNATASLAQMTVTGEDQTWTIPANTPASGAVGWWRVEVRGAGGIAGVDTKNKNGYPGTIGQMDSTNQLQAISAPLYVYTAAPAVQKPSVPLPTALNPAGSDDGPIPVRSGALGGFSGFPSLAVSGSTTHLVVERHGAGTTTVIHRVLPDGPETDLSVGTGTARMPRVAARGQDVWVVWHEELAGQIPRRPDIMMRHSADGGTTFGPVKQITAVAAGVRAERAVVAVTSAGQPVVAWMANPGPAAFDIYAQVIGVDSTPIALSSTGKTVTAASPTDTRSAVYPASLFPTVTVLPDGTVAIGWQDDRFDPDPLFTGHDTMTDTSTVTTDPDAWEPMIAVRPAGGTWSAPRRVAPDITLAQRHPVLIADGAGALVMVWDTKSSMSSSESNLQLRWSRSTDGGSTWAMPAALDPFGVGMAQRPRLGLDPDGTVRVVWYDSRAEDWKWRVRTATLGSEGWSVGSDVSTVGNSTFPDIAVGRIAIVTDRNQAGQRDRTQQVAVADLSAPPATSLPETPYAAALPIAAAVAGAAAIAYRKHSTSED